MKIGGIDAVKPEDTRNGGPLECADRYRVGNGNYIRWWDLIFMSTIWKALSEPRRVRMEYAATWHIHIPKSNPQFPTLLLYSFRIHLIYITPTRNLIYMKYFDGDNFSLSSTWALIWGLWKCAPPTINDWTREIDIPFSLLGVSHASSSLLRYK